MVVHACNPSTHQEAGAGGLWPPDQDKSRAVNMAQRTKIIVTRLNDLTLMLRTHKVEPTSTSWHLTALPAPWHKHPHTFFSFHCHTSHMQKPTGLQWSCVSNKQKTRKDGKEPGSGLALGPGSKWNASLDAPENKNGSSRRKEFRPNGLHPHCSTQPLLTRKTGRLDARKGKE